MSEPFISIEEIKRRAAKAVDQGLPMRSSPYPLDSDAGRHWIIGYWLREIDLLKQEQEEA